LWKLDRRAISSKPGAALKRAAKAAKALQKAYFSLNPQDREWVHNIQSSETLYAKPHLLDDTILHLSLVFSSAIGRPSPLPPQSRRFAVLMTGRAPVQIKDQRFRELVFNLLGTADDLGGKFTFNKNDQSGTLLKALNILRNGGHVPKGLVP